MMYHFIVQDALLPVFVKIFFIPLDTEYVVSLLKLKKNSFRCKKKDITITMLILYHISVLNNIYSKFLNQPDIFSY